MILHPVGQSRLGLLGEVDRAWRLVAADNSAGVGGCGGHLAVLHQTRAMATASTMKPNANPAASKVMRWHEFIAHLATIKCATFPSVTNAATRPSKRSAGRCSFNAWATSLTFVGHRAPQNAHARRS